MSHSTATQERRNRTNTRAAITFKKMQTETSRFWRTCLFLAERYLWAAAALGDEETASVHHFVESEALKASFYAWS